MLVGDEIWLISGCRLLSLSFFVLLTYLEGEGQMHKNRMENQRKRIDHYS
jgi:hypothetical protein